jgi:hypothetical protein
MAFEWFAILKSALQPKEIEVFKTLRLADRSQDAVVADQKSISDASSESAVCCLDIILSDYRVADCSRKTNTLCVEKRVLRV